MLLQQAIVDALMHGQIQLGFLGALPTRTGRPPDLQKGRHKRRLNFENTEGSLKIQSEFPNYSISHEWVGILLQSFMEVSSIEFEDMYALYNIILS